MQRVSHLIAAIILGASFAAGCGAGARSAPEWRVAPASGADSLTVHHDGGSTIIDIRSAKGIGGATVTWTAGDRPREAWLCFHLHGLEELRIDSGDAGYLLAFSNTDPPRVRQELTQGDAPPRLLAAGDPHWLRWRVESTSGRAPTPPERIWVEIPSFALRDRARDVHLRWIDFYR